MSNLNVDLGLCNGSECTLWGTTADGRHCLLDVPSHLLMHFPGSGAHLQGLPPGVVPITTKTVSFTYEVAKGVPVKFHRRGFPVLPSDALTYWASQSATYPWVVAEIAQQDGRRTSDRACTYVALSRCTDIHQLFILRDLMFQDIARPLPAHLIADMKRLEEIQDATIAHLRQAVPAFEDWVTSPPATS